MPLRLDISPPDGPVRTVPLEPGRTRVIAGPAEQYRLIGERGEIPDGVTIRRIGNALVVGGLAGGDELELANFFGACRPGRDCALAFDAPGTTVATVTNETLPLAALADGSFLLYGTADNTLPSVVVPAPTTGITPGYAAAGLAALVGLGAGLGGGGGSGGSSPPTSAAPPAVLGAAQTAPPTVTAAAAPPPSAPAPESLPPAAPSPTPPATPEPPAPAAPPADITRPAVSISDNTAGVANGAVTFTFQFTEPVTGFTEADVVVSGGTRGALLATGDGLGYTLTVAPTAGVQAGQITVDVASGAATDAAGNPSTLASRATQAYDTATPTLAITDSIAGVANRTTLFTFTFAEPVTGFTDGDITVSGGARGALSASGDGRTYTMSVTPPAGVAAGQIVVDAAAGAATDAAGNASAAARATQAVDTLAPTQRVSAFTVTDDVSPGRGSVAPNATTNDPSPEIALSLNAVLGSGDVLTVTRDGNTVRTVTSGQSTSFVDGPLSRGGATHVYSAAIVDAAGNSTVLDLNGVSVAGTSFSIVVI